MSQAERLRTAGHTVASRSLLQAINAAAHLGVARATAALGALAQWNAECRAAEREVERRCGRLPNLE